MPQKQQHQHSEYAPNSCMMNVCVSTVGEPRGTQPKPTPSEGSPYPRAVRERGGFSFRGLSTMPGGTLKRSKTHETTINDAPKIKFYKNLFRKFRSPPLLSLKQTLELCMFHLRPPIPNLHLHK